MNVKIIILCAVVGIAAGSGTGVITSFDHSAGAQLSSIQSLPLQTASVVYDNAPITSYGTPIITETARLAYQPSYTTAYTTPEVSRINSPVISAPLVARTAPQAVSYQSSITTHPSSARLTYAATSPVYQPSITTYSSPARLTTTPVVARTYSEPLNSYSPLVTPFTTSPVVARLSDTLIAVPPTRYTTPEVSRINSPVISAPLVARTAPQAVSYQSSITTHPSSARLTYAATSPVYQPSITTYSSPARLTTTPVVARTYSEPLNSYSPLVTPFTTSPVVARLSDTSIAVPSTRYFATPVTSQTASLVAPVTRTDTSTTPFITTGTVLDRTYAAPYTTYGATPITTLTSGQLIRSDIGTSAPLVTLSGIRKW